MIDYYVEVRFVHLASVLASGVLFAIRGLAVQTGARWPMIAPLRYLSYAVDTVVLTAAVLLSGMLRQYPFVEPWLTAKVLLIVIYIVLGSFALKRGRTAAVRRLCYIAALATFAMILSIAHTRDPFGGLGSGVWDGPWSVVCSLWLVADLQFAQRPAPLRFRPCASRLPAGSRRRAGQARGRRAGPGSTGR